MAAILTSWKEIACYLGKGVRTVQRWEREMGLPVRRPKSKEKQIVLAFPDELEEWIRRQPPTSTNRQPTDRDSDSSQASGPERSEAPRSTLIMQCSRAELQDFHRAEIERLRSLLAHIAQEIRILSEGTESLVRSVHDLRERDTQNQTPRLDNARRTA
jgi:hypothetical protein